ncbi:hypothetical protein COU49_02035 [Candidatus Nomurabacteria bacterium CG10_big_fil_rev_8_21_14_0_10_35_16]|uniref:Thioredoxin domain-containing protein n=1 Tax=Candidatus Nomurabacteria bacterium CG10_big_fil_rev_8_21_14_0_10_35_16 TaxID=1974731 RepID=A0A2H0TB58_9BACT|nr:MAG: hypothetical protein COU49_02035 [Candidatus Nomurabacteria bacterium CG10_big_fil_rev_8_21_14_0_10_35_16]
MFKKILIIFLFTALLLVSGGKILAQNTSDINVYFFWGEGCPHCEKEVPFLESLKEKYPRVQIHQFEVWKNIQNQNFLIEIGKELKVNISGVPFTVIGNKHIIGYYNDATTGTEIENLVKNCLENICPDPVAKIVGLTIPNTENPAIPAEPISEDLKKEKIIHLPFLGEINAMNFSLPALTVIMGALDGFNPCAMWTLIFLISLLLGMEDRRKMWILGSTFIVASALVYFIFMAAWLNLILFIGLVMWVRILIGLIALFGGGYNLKEYFTTPEAVCKVTGSEKRQKFFEKLKEIAHQKNFYLAFGGIIILAFAVNLVELVCSAGLPAVYTQILALSNLATWQYYAYILLYILIFMLDDLFVFIVAMVTLQMTGITTKYTRLSHLIGGILMLIIGLLLIFKPELLMFG